MSQSAKQRSEEFLKISGQFKLGALVTESSHPVTANLSEVAEHDVARALDLLFQVDEDVLRTCQKFVQSGRAAEMANNVLASLERGGRMFFTGCGSTGRLSILLVSIWRDFWQQHRNLPGVSDLENRAFSVMAGGDFALIKSVEGFEDFAAFGRRQIADLGVRAGDVVFAITEGGETSFVIGTAWEGVAAGAKVYFIYNNPDAVLCEQVERSREVIQDKRIEKLNLTTGPMAITGSTRMQATSIQLCVMLTVLEMVLRKWTGRSGAGEVPGKFLEQLMELHATLRSPATLSHLAKFVELEERVYRSGGKNNYFANRFGIDVLTDTTERSPTYCTPPFRKFDDVSATESWAFLFLPEKSTRAAWQQILKRDPNCVEWSEADVRTLVPPERLERTLEIVRRIGCGELMRFRVGQDGLPFRKMNSGDCATAIVSGEEMVSSAADFFEAQLTQCAEAGASVGIICFGKPAEQCKLPASGLSLIVPVPKNDFLLDGVARVGVKLLLNALSTCTMVRLGRVMGNYMIWVVASNLKLIDRATRYIQKLTGLAYEESNRLLFESVEYIEPRMKSDQAYPPVVGLSVLRARHGISLMEAEDRLKRGG